MDVVWGLDGIGKSVLERKLDSPVSSMSLPKIKNLLEEFDVELSFLVEETDFHEFHRYGNVDSGRFEKSEEAKRRTEEIYLPNGFYSQLVERFSQLADGAIDVRSAELRRRELIYRAVLQNRDYLNLKEKAESVYEKSRMAVDNRTVSLGEAFAILSKNPDAELRRQAYFGYARLEDLESALFEQVNCFNGLVSRLAPGFTPPIQMMLDYGDFPPDLKQEIIRLVEGTRGIYNDLVRELITDKQINAWDLRFLINSNDPFSKLEVPYDSRTLMGIGKDLLVDLGFERSVVEDTFNPGKPDVLFDIGDRKDKKSLAVCYSLGPFSGEKMLIFYNPSAFPANRKRWSTLPHELGHGMHYFFGRKNLKDPVFYNEPLPSLETVSSFAEDASLDKLTIAKYFPATGEDAMFLDKWGLLTSLHSIYFFAGMALGELSMYENGTSSARESFKEAKNFAKPDNVANVDVSDYLMSQSLIGYPAYTAAFLHAKIYAIALRNGIQEKYGTIFTPATARILTEGIMTGNMAPMHERISSIIGTHDLIDSLIHYFRNAYSELRAPVLV